MKKITFLALLLSHYIYAQDFTNYSAADGLLPGIISSMTLDTNGDLWFGERSEESTPGIGTFKNGVFDIITMDDGAISNETRGIVEASNGDLWFATANGVGVFNGTEWTQYTTETGTAFGTNSIWSIIEASNGDIWVGYSSGVSRFKNGSWEHFTTADGVPGSTILSILEDSNGNLWFGSFSLGLTMYDGVDTWTNFTTADGLAADDIFALLEDTNGNIWIGNNSTEGLTVYNGIGFDILTTADGLNSNKARSIYQDSEDNIWVLGTGISKFNGTEWSVFNTENSNLTHPEVRSMQEDNDGNLWFGHFEGLSVLEGILSVGDNTLETTIRVYPNPTQNVLTIETGTKSISKVAVYNLLGQNVTSSTSQRVDATSLDNGIYLMKVTFEDQSTATTRFIKE